MIAKAPGSEDPAAIAGSEDPTVLARPPGAKGARAVVVGAGFSGLATAYFLERSGYAVEVFERAEREGGLLGTTVTDHGIAESAANAILNSARVEALFSDLGIPVVPAKRESRARYIFREGRLRRWPLGFAATFYVFQFAFRFFFDRAAVAPRPEESLQQWGRRVLGEEATEFLLLPAFQGIYAGDGKRLSATLLLGGVFARKKAPKPKIRGSVSAPGGMGGLVRRLRSLLDARGVVFRFGREAPPFDPATLTFYCGSAAQTAEALAAASPEVAGLLAKIEMLPLVSVTAFFKRDPRAKRGFGVLFPPSERFWSLGVLYNDAIFPGRVARAEEVQSETWILGGARRPGVAGMPMDAVLREFLGDRNRLSGRAGPIERPIYYVLHRWSRAIPYYTIELERTLTELSRALRGSGRLRLMGNYLGGIGLAKILDRAAEEVEKATRT